MEMYGVKCYRKIKTDISVFECETDEDGNLS